MMELISNIFMFIILGCVAIVMLFAVGFLIAFIISEIKNNIEYEKAVNEVKRKCKEEKK